MISRKLNAVRAEISTLPDFITAFLSWPVVPARAGDRKGQHSIRINDQFRLCFVWKDGNATDVEIVDYH